MIRTATDPFGIVMPPLPKRPRSADVSSGDSMLTDSMLTEDSFICGGFENVANTSSANTSTVIEDPFYGLSDEVRNYLRDQRGIKDLYEWQRRCLLQQMTRGKRNLIVTLPTSGGKTLLAEILILKTILSEDKDAIFILPFVSLVQEKVKALQPLGLEFGFLVEEYAATRGRIPPIRRRVKKSVYVATIERSQSLINSLIQLKRVSNVGLVIIDELHMIGEGQNRGAKLEQVITMLQFTAKNMQIVGLSATLSNIDEVKVFLDADVFTSDFRPVPLTEYVKLGNSVYKVKRPEGPVFNEMLEMDRKFQNASPDLDPDGISKLVSEVIPDCSCLVFCPSRKNTERVALLLTNTLPKTLRNHKLEEKRSLLVQLKSEAGGGGLCPVQRRCIEFGVAYHHAGLTTDERNTLQDAFTNGTLCVICCTSTLAAGVNLPAKRVILRAPIVGNKFLTKQQYRQMSGRAGRAGLDTSGESILVTSGTHLQNTLEILRGSVERCCSSLVEDDGLGRYLLNVIGLEVVTSKKDLFNMLGRTLAGIQKGADEVIQRAEAILTDLISAGFISKETKEDDDVRLTIRDFGWAVLDSGISTEIAQQVRAHLLTAVQCLVLNNYLHLLYCIVPFDRQDGVTPNWDVFYNEFCSLSEPEKKVFQVLSVPEAYLLKRKIGKLEITGTIDEVAERLYLALIIRRLWNQESVWSVSGRFGVDRGTVQSISQACAASASSLTRFVERMDDLWALKQLLPDFSKRLTYCAKPELIPLMEIQGVKKARASQLFQAGFKNPAAIAKSNAESLVASIEYLSRRQAVQMITSAKMWLREKGELLVEQAEESGLSIDELIVALSQSI